MVRGGLMTRKQHLIPRIFHSIVQNLAGQDPHWSLRIDEGGMLVVELAQKVVRICFGCAYSLSESLFAHNIGNTSL